MIMSHDDRFEFGDQVRHVKRPEWGVGAVIRTEDTSVGGVPTQRIVIRFPNAGMKRLVVAQAALERVSAEEHVTSENTSEPSSRLEAWDKMEQSEWLGPLARRKIEETMISLPESSCDPFASLTQQLSATLKLYRFNRSGRGLVDWAVAQSGLKDPLSRFTRQDLEQLFDRWSHERDAQLSRLLASARHESGVVDRAVQSAPASARDAIRRCMALR